MSEFYGPGDDQESEAVIRRAVELGVTLLDTADMYGPYKNEELVGGVLRGIGGVAREHIVLATKFGITRSGADPSVRGINGRPDYVRSACEASLKRLGVTHIDLYYQHRVDTTVPIEETVGAMADLVRQGKVMYAFAVGIGLGAGPRKGHCANTGDQAQGLSGTERSGCASRYFTRGYESN